VCLKQSSNDCLQLLFSADRAFHLEKEIIPLLKRGIGVICDRYAFSSLAFGLPSSNDLDWLINLQRKFLLPDITFFLKVSSEVCIKRIQESRFETTLFEKKEIFEKVWQNYEKISRMFDNVYVVDGERPIEVIAQEVQKIVREKLNL